MVVLWIAETNCIHNLMLALSTLHSIFCISAHACLLWSNILHAQISSCLNTVQSCFGDVVVLCVGPCVACIRCRSSMEEEVPFEAQQVLQELYSLDAVVGGIQAGNWERSVLNRARGRALTCFKSALAHFTCAIRRFECALGCSEYSDA